MKKKKIGLSIVVAVTSLVLSAVIAFGVLLFIRNKNMQQTGNVLGVSWYNQTDREFTITTAEQLYELAQLSDFYTFEEQTIYLGSDIILNEGNAEEWAEKGPNRRWSPIVGFCGTFDGQGHTISGLYARSHEASMALFADTEYTCTIQNIKLTNSYFHTSGGRGVASFVSQGGGKFYKLYSEAVFDHDGQSCGGIASQIDKQAIFEECWFDGTIHANDRNIGGILDVANSPRVEIKHSLFSGTINQNYKMDENIRTAGICGRVEKGAGIIVTDTLSCGKINSNYKTDVGSLFGFSGPETTVDISDTFTSRDTWCSPLGSKGGTYTGTSIDLFEECLIGTKAYQWTSLDFEKYWTVVEDDTPVLQYFADKVEKTNGVTKAFDTSWYDGNSRKYTITTKEQLYGVFYLSKRNDFKGITIQLGADIVVNEGKAKDWKENRPENIWYPIEEFAGIFDGQGHTISGICLVEGRELYTLYTGLFGRAMQGSVIKNFRLTNSYFESTREKANATIYMGSIAGETRGTIDSVYSDAIMYTNGNQVGGITGRMGYLDKSGKKPVLVTNCWFDGDITANKTYMIGGVVGIAYRNGTTNTNLEISHCLNSGVIRGNRIDTNDTFAAGQRMGGILGYDLSTTDLSIIDCLNVGTFELIDINHAGPIMGTVAHAKSNFTITDVYATAESCLKEGRTIHAPKGNVIGGAAALPTEWYMGKNAYQYTNLDFTNYWAIVEGGTPILKTFASKVPSTAGLKKLVDTSWYSAEKETLIIDSVEDLYGFYALSTYKNFKGQTVKLNADLKVNEGSAADWKQNAPENKWYPIGNNSCRFAGTFDGQGHTISGIYFSDHGEKDTYNGLFGVTDLGSVVKNFKLTNSYFERIRDDVGAGFMGSIVGEVRGTVEGVYSDAIIYTNAREVGGIVGRMAYTDTTGVQQVTVSNCWFNGTITGDKTYMLGGIAGIAYRSAEMKTNLVIEHCLNTGKIIGNRVDTNDTVAAGQRMGGILGYDLSTIDMSIIDCLNAGAFELIDVNHAGAIVGTIGKAGSTFVIQNTYATAESCPKDGRAMHAPKGTIIGGPAIVSESMLTDTNAYQYTTLDFKNYWAVMDDSIPELKKFSGSGESVDGLAQLVDISWYDSNADTFVLDSMEDLYGFWSLSSADNFAGKTVKLGADIIVNQEKVAGKADTWGVNPPELLWSGIGSYNAPFAGTFDGQGHTISGIYIKNDGGTGAGLFNATAPGSKVKNLRLTDSYIESNGGARVGSVIGNMRGGIEAVYSDAMVVANGSANMVGGLVGTTKYYNAAGGDITNCWFDGQVIGNGNSNKIGGITGALMKTGSGQEIIITDCLMTGTITYTGTNGNQYIGGIFGDNNNVSSLVVKIVRCLVSGKIDIQPAHKYVGSYAGAFRKANATCTITDSYATKGSYRDGTRNIMVDQIASGNGTIAGNSEDNFVANDELTRDNTAGLFNSEAWTIAKDGTPVLASFVDLLVPQVITADTSWYDGTGTYTINTANELYGFLELSETEDFAGETVKLGADIVINEERVEGKVATWGTESPEYLWTGIGSYALPFAGTFDGQGYTITGICLKNTGLTGNGFFNATAAGSNIRDFRLVDSYIESTNGGRIGSVVGNLRGCMSDVYSNATVVALGSANMVGGLIGTAKYHIATGGANVVNTVIQNCWYDGDIIAKGSANKIGGIAGATMRDSSGKEIHFIDCLMTGTIDYKASHSNQYVGGIFGDNNNQSMIVKVTRCLVTGKITVEGTHKYVGSIAGAFRKSGGTCTITDSYVTSESYMDGSNNIMVDQLASGNGTVNGNSSGNFVSETMLSGGTASGLFTLVSGTTAWVAASDGIPVLASFEDLYEPVEKEYEVSWYNGSGDYTLTTVDQLYGFAYLSQTLDFDGETIRLGANITFNDEATAGDSDTWGANAPDLSWPGIGSRDNDFAGTFDGQGNIIYGLYFKNTGAAGRGFFNATAPGSIVKNLYIKDSYVESEGGTHVGSVIGTMRGSMENVYSNATVVANGSANQVGGLVGVAKYYTVDGEATANDAIIRSCWFAGKVYGHGNSNKIGGVAGGVMRNGSGFTINFIDCLMSGSITYDGTNGNQYVGGIFGDNNNQGSQVVNITRCLVSGTIDIQVAHKYVGSYAGAFRKAGSTCTITDSYATIESYKDGNNNIMVDQLTSGNGTIAGNSANNFVAKTSLSQTTTSALFTLINGSTAWTTAQDGIPVLSALDKAN